MTDDYESYGNFPPWLFLYESSSVDGRHFWRYAWQDEKLLAFMLSTCGDYCQVTAETRLHVTVVWGTSSFWSVQYVANAASNGKLEWLSRYRHQRSYCTLGCVNYMQVFPGVQWFYCNFGNAHWTWYSALNLLLYSSSWDVHLAG